MIFFRPTNEQLIFFVRKMIFFRQKNEWPLFVKEMTDFSDCVWYFLFNGQFTFNNSLWWFMYYVTKKLIKLYTLLHIYM